MVAGNQQFILQFTADTTQMQSALRGFTGNAKTLLSEIQTAASRPIRVNTVAASGLTGGSNIPGAASALAGPLSVRQNEVTNAALAGGASRTQATRAGQEAVSQAAASLATQYKLTEAQQTQLQRTIQQQIIVNSQVTRATASTAVQRFAESESIRTGFIRERTASDQALRAKAQRIVAEQQEAEALRRLTREEARLAGLRGAEARAAIGRAGQAGQAGGTGTTPGEFLRGGFRSTLRFAIPSALLFGTASGIASIVRESEELEQINVRLAGQFRNLGTLGTFDTIVDDLGLAVNEANRASVAAAQLDIFRESAFGISESTGVAAEEVLALGGSFIGFFASIEGTDGDLNQLATQATEVASQFSVITGLAPEEAFNDLTAAVRVFSTDGNDLNAQLVELTDNLVSVSDTTGIAANELADFVGRIAPIAETAGFAAEEVAAIGGALLQASGLGGAQLAEQFGRIISTFGDGLDEELADLAISVPEIGLDLDDIFSGETRDVLFQLINGFEELSEAQQRQVIASIGSRREGNVLATLLTNQQGVLQGLASQQDNAGAAAERFADVSETLTVRFNQLKVQFEQLGLTLLEGGLGEILQDLIGIVSEFADLLDGTVAPAIRIVADVIGAIPAELVPLGVALLVANRALVGFGGAIAGAGESLRRLRLGPAIAEIGATSASSAREVGLLTSSVRVLGGALAVATVAITAWNAFQSLTGRESEDVTSRQDRLNETLRAAGNEYVTIADRARAYNEELERTAELQDRTIGSSTNGEFAAGPAAAAASAGLGQGFRDLAGEEDALGELLILIQESGLGLNQLAGAAVDSAPAIKQLSEAYDDLAGSASTAEARAGGAIQGLNSVFGDQELTDDTRSLVSGLREVILQSEDGFESVRSTVDVLRTLSEDNDDLIANAAIEVGLALSQLQQQATTSDAVQAQITALFAQQRALGGAEGDLALIIGAESLIPDLGEESPEEAANRARQEFAAEVGEGLADLAQVRAQLEAGVTTQAEFNSVATETVSRLRTQLAAADAAGNAEQAARIIGEIADIEEQLAEDAIARFEADQEIIELLGQETGTVDQLLSIALDPVVQRSPEEFRSLVVDLISKEQEIAIEAASRAQSAEDAAALLEGFELSSEAQDLFVETQIRSEAGALIEAVAVASGEDIDATFDLIVAEVQAGRDLELVLRDVLLQQIADLEALVQVADPFAIDGLTSQLDALRSTLERVGAAEIPTIVTGDQVGIDGERIESTVEALNDQYELVLAGIEADSQILSAFGIDNRPENLAAQAAQLFTILSDPNFTDPDARFEVAVQLAGVLQAIASLEGAELVAANQAVQLLTDGADVEQLVTAEAVFASISNQSNIFNAYLNTYLDVGEETLNALNRNIANFVAGGASVAEALAKASEIAIAELQRQIALIETSIFVTGLGGGDASAQQEQLGVLKKELEQLQADQFKDSFGAAPDINIGGVEVPDVGPAGPTAADTKNAASDLAAAQFELLRAQFALDPVALARIAQDEAAAALASATTAADRIRAQAQRINADREFAQAIQDVFNAQTELAISLAEIAGNTEEALQLGVDQAKDQLDFLIKQGAGEAAIADAERSLAEAQERQFEGLINDQLGDLDFLFQIGELTSQQYIAQLEGILSTLDPIADEDLYRDITLQIQDLRNRTNDLSTNLGNFDIPSLFEVRRLASTGFGGTPDQAGPGGRVDNRTISIQMNISDGVSWEDAVDVINDAIGTDAPVTFETRRY